MNNIFITTAYNKKEDHGILINRDEISVHVFNTLYDKNDHDNSYSDQFTNQINLDIDIIGEYLYLLNVFVSDKLYGNFVNERNINISLHQSEQDAINAGKNLIINGIIRDIKNLYDEDPDDDDLILSNVQNFYNYRFRIIKIKTDRTIFESEEDQLKYYHKNLDKNRNNLYDFLLDIVGGYQINDYSMDGKLYDSTYLPLYRTIDNFSIKSLLRYHVNKFNIGDTVRILYNPQYQKYNDIFIIKNKYIKDHSIYDSKDPLHHREGYILCRKNDLLLNPINEYFDDLFYDEDLELVEEYYEN